MVRTVEEIEDDATEAAIEDSIFLRIIKFGLKYPDGFTFSEIMTGLSLEGWERTTVQEYLHNAYQNAYNTRIGKGGGNSETPFFVIKNGGSNYQDDSYKYTTSFDAHFKYLDYKELQLARQNAKEAKRLSVWAIRISLGAVAISAIVPWWTASNVTQTVRIDPQQLESLNTAVDSSVSTSSTKLR